MFNVNQAPSSCFYVSFQLLGLLAVGMGPVHWRRQCLHHLSPPMLPANAATLECEWPEEAIPLFVSIPPFF